MKRKKYIQVEGLKRKYKKPLETINRKTMKLSKSKPLDCK
jgi:hypothetical protein